MKEKVQMKIFAVFVVLLFLIGGLSFFDTSTAQTASPKDSDGDGLYDWQEEVMDSDVNDSYDPGLYCMYKERYRTRDYRVWENYSSEDDEFWISTESVVVRRGTTLEFGGVEAADREIIGSKKDLDPLSSQGKEVEIPEDNTVGRYTYRVSKGNWSNSMEIDVIFDPWDTGLSKEKRKTYGYDEGSNRDERGYIYTSSGNVYQGELHPFGDGNENIPDIYRLALAGVGNMSSQQLAAVKLTRLVAQRNTAVPAMPGQNPQFRDARDILFYETDRLEGLTLEDAEKLAMNGENIDELASEGKTKRMNNWCDESALSLTSLLRSVGIPSRVVSIHQTEDTEMMGHFISEAWFQDSLYHTSWGEDEGGWFAFDADEWNVEWTARDPVFWMPMGECYSSRANYGRMIEHLFRVRYSFEVENYYIFEAGEEEDPDPIHVTSSYKRGDIPFLEYGTITKYKGRGGGDLYKLKVENTSSLSISTSGGTEARIYMNEEEYPALKISYRGYPPDRPNMNITSDEVTLEPGEYYIGIYAPEAGDNSIEGNYGTYTLELEEAKSESGTETEESGGQMMDYAVSLSLLLIWVLSYIGMKKL